MKSNGKERDALTLMLESRRSQATRDTYRKNLQYFFQDMFPGSSLNQAVEMFLKLPRFKAVEKALNYKALLMKQGLAENTVNGRLAAVKALVNFARNIGCCEFDLTDVTGERAKPYRDTSGLSIAQMKMILAVPKQDTVRGSRDYAILTLLWENALRRGELVRLNTDDFDATNQTLFIQGKGRGSQKEIISLSEKATQAIVNWLEIRGKTRPGEPLFIATNNRHRGHRLTGETIRYLVVSAVKDAGISKQMSPHRIRHSSITAALEATNGDVVKVQKLSRHSKVDTLMIYNDRREGLQAEVTDLLSKMI